MINIIFFILALFAVIGAIGLVLHRIPTMAAVLLAVTMVAIGGIYILLKFPFLGFFQIIIYAGAIVVMFLYVVMAVGIEEEGRAIGKIQLVLTILSAIVILLMIVPPLYVGFDLKMGEMASEIGDLDRVGLFLSGPYLIPFEIISLILVGAMVSAVILSKREDG